MILPTFQEVIGQVTLEERAAIRLGTLLFQEVVGFFLVTQLGQNHVLSEEQFLTFRMQISKTPYRLKLRVEILVVGGEGKFCLVSEAVFGGLASEPVDGLFGSRSIFGLQMPVEFIEQIIKCLVRQGEVDPTRFFLGNKNHGSGSAEEVFFKELFF